MGMSDRKLEQGFVPVVGHVLSWIYVGFQAEDIAEWHWFQEEWEGPLGRWSKLPGESNFLELTEEMLSARIMARVRLRSGVYIAGVTWPVVSSQELEAFGFEEFRHRKQDLINQTKELKKVRDSIRIERDLLHADKSYQSLVDRNEQLLSDRKKENKAIREERQRIWEAGSVSEKLNEIHEMLSDIEKRESDLKMAETRLRANRDSLREKEETLNQLSERNRKRELDFRDELIRNFEEKKTALKDLEARLLSEQQAFLDNQDLQRRLHLLNAELEEAEIMWDVLAKANNLKLKLSTSAKAEIIRIVSNEVESQKAVSRAALRNNSSVFDSVFMCGSCGNIVNACACG
jgi:hypothetical protein